MRMWPFIVAVFMTCGSTVVRARASTPRGNATAVVSRAHSARAQARELYDAGRRVFALGEFRQALERFTRAYELAPLSGFLFNIAQCHRFLGDCRKAVFFYRGYLRDNPGAPNTQVVEDLARRCERQVSDEDDRSQKAEAAFREGMQDFRSARYRQALTRFAAAYALAKRPGYLFHLAQTHRLLEEYPQALHFYQAYLRENPGAPEMQLVEGLAHECRRKLKEREARQRALHPALPDRSARPPLADPRESNLPTRRQRLTRSPWLWATVSATVVAAVLGIGLGVGLRSQRDPLVLPSTQLGTVDWRP